MRTCRGCGGVLGRDCFNEQECVWITESINSDNAQLADKYRQERRFESLREANTINSYDDAVITIASMAEQITIQEQRIKALECAINAALNIRDLWGNPDDLSHVDPAHDGEVKMLAAMEMEFKRLITKQHNHE